MSTESERLITALIDHAQAMQQRSEAQQDLFDRVLEALPSRVGAATCEGLTDVVRAESQRLHAKATFVEQVARSATLRWGLIFTIGILVLGGPHGVRRVVAGASGAPVRSSSSRPMRRRCGAAINRDRKTNSSPSAVRARRRGCVCVSMPQPSGMGRIVATLPCGGTDYGRG